MIKNLKIRGLLSFGPKEVNLELGPLNVLIGPNGSGKSNLVEILSVLKAAPTDIAAPIRKGGGIWEWIWKGPREEGDDGGSVTAVFENNVRHFLQFDDVSGAFVVEDESISQNWGQDERTNFYTSNLGVSQTYLAAEFHDLGNFDLEKNEVFDLKKNEASPEVKVEINQSILSQVKFLDRFRVFGFLQESYSGISIYRNWIFGNDAACRKPCSIDEKSDVLSMTGKNLPIILQRFQRKEKPEFLKYLSEIFSGITDYNVTSEGGRLVLRLVEQDGREIPASRLSDGTLRFMCLLAILINSKMPPLIVLEEPELGLHPDIMPVVAKLLTEASEKTQVIVTTHSRELIDALSSAPESVIVCERENGRTTMERLEADALKIWMEEYGLGKLWGMGHIGGNRW